MKDQNKENLRPAGLVISIGENERKTRSGKESVKNVLINKSAPVVSG